MNSGRRTAVGIVALVALFSLSEQVHAVDFEKLLMPGRVIAGHAEFEADCEACHDVDSARATDVLCTSCHENIGSDIASEIGFHGRLSTARDSGCVACHTDHEGRDADIVGLQSGLFDHAFTDFPLRGAHSAAECSDCHADGTRFHVAPSVCGDCHGEVDVHDGRLGDSCGDCHSQALWQGAEFDHAQTGYSLTGKHADVECVDCHRGNRFTGTSTSCSSCHAVDDIHAGDNGSACQDCHNTNGWQTFRFDHLEETGFSLADGHSGLACGDCHQSPDHTDVFPNGCVDCHRVDDNHQGRNGEQCSDCHRPTTWSDSIFDHGDTGFYLRDAHAGLVCSACHKASRVDQVTARCSTCHAVDDSHGGAMQEDCGACHAETEWRAPIAFDHDLSSFPLLGMHATVACGACHEDNRFPATETACASCHAGDDPHAGSLGPVCGDCHTANSWTATTFDHDVHTDFPLDGGHADLACGACHRDEEASASDVPSDCGGCHKANDVHDGQFGDQCGDCHSTFSFSGVEP